MSERHRKTLKNIRNEISPSIITSTVSNILLDNSINNLIPYLNKVKITKSEINSTEIGLNIPSSAKFTSLQVGDLGNGGNVLFYGDNGSFTWDGDNSNIKIEGGFTTKFSLNSKGNILNINSLGNKYDLNISSLLKKTRISGITSSSVVKNWIDRSASINNSWQFITWSPELSIFVAVSNNGTNRIMTSTNGITWNTGNILENNWVSLTWSLELSIFVGVSTTGNNRITTSANGITWNPIDIGITNILRSVCWSPDLSLFCCVCSGGNDRVIISANGIDWTYINCPLNEWRSVCWSSELYIFCAVSESGNDRVMTSPDGYTWELSIASSPSNWKSICWSSELSLFCAVSDGGPERVMTSPDGIEWIYRLSPVSEWRSVCWSNELSVFCATSYGGIVMYSFDGIHWDTVTVPSNNQWESVCWSPELSIFCAVSSNGTNRVMTSKEGIPTFLNIDAKIGNGVGDDPTFNSLTINNNTLTNTLNVTNQASVGSLLVNGLPVTGADPFGIYKINEIGTVLNTTSSRGRGFNKKDISIIKKTRESWAISRNCANKWFYKNSPIFSQIIWSPELGLFFANTGWSSNNGKNWIQRTLPSGGSGNWSICWSSELFLFVGVRTDNIITSTDGIVWNSIPSPPLGDWTSLCWSPDVFLFVVVSNNGNVLISSDGTNWILRNTSNVDCKSVVWSSELYLFCSVSSSGTNRIMTSTDGEIWNSINSPIFSWKNICWSPQLGIFCAISNSRIIISSDGINWEEFVIISSEWETVCWSTEISLFVAVSSSEPIIIISSNGVDWEQISVPIISSGICWSKELSIFCTGGNNGNMISNIAIPTVFNTFGIISYYVYLETETIIYDILTGAFTITINGPNGAPNAVFIISKNDASLSKNADRISNSKGLPNTQLTVTWESNNGIVLKKNNLEYSDYYDIKIM